MADEPMMQMVMPDLKEEEIEKVEALGDSEPIQNSVAVPMLTDVPTLVPVNAFVQPLDFTPVINTDPNAVRLSAVPVNVAHGSATAEKLGKIFDVSQLDRQPQAIVQAPPVFPSELKKEYREAAVTLEFIITAKGDVVAPRAITSDNYRFEMAASNGVLKWRFKPGMKGGRPVNTRTQITIKFKVTDSD